MEQDLQQTALILLESAMHILAVEVVLVYGNMRHKRNVSVGLGNRQKGRQPPKGEAYGLDCQRNHIQYLTDTDTSTVH